MTTVQEPGYVMDGQYPLLAMAPIPPVFETAAAVRPPDRAAYYGKMRTRKQYAWSPGESTGTRETGGPHSARPQTQSRGSKPIARGRGLARHSPTRTQIFLVSGATVGTI